jgi:hypothetical protein
MPHLLPFFQWCDHTAAGEAIRNSRVLFPIIESVHLLALTVLLGTVLALNLRLLGAAMRLVPLASVAKALAPLTFWSLATMVATGTLLFLSEALKCYDNPPFLFKMEALFAAILFQWAVVPATVRAAVNSGKTGTGVRSAATALVSLALWFSVGAAGRAIGFY